MLLQRLGCLRAVKLIYLPVCGEKNKCILLTSCFGKLLRLCNMKQVAK